MGGSGYLVVHHDWLTGRLGQELGLTGPLHGDEKPSGGVHAGPDCQQAVVAKDGRAPITESVGNALTLLRVGDYACVVIEQDVVPEEDATVLGDRVQSPPQCRPGLPVEGVRVGGGPDVGPGHVEAGVDGERRLVDGGITLENLPGMADQ